MVSTVIITLRCKAPETNGLTALVTEALREYLEHLDNGLAGNEQQEAFVSGNGIEVTITAAHSPVADIPKQKPVCRIYQSERSDEYIEFSPPGWP